jgi:peptidoglycan/LPS O-acetylase OafA/YrhL
MSALAMTVALPATRKASEFRHVRALDGIRGIAYLLVLGHHCFSIGQQSGPWPVGDRLLTWFFPSAFWVSIYSLYCPVS